MSMVGRVVIKSPTTDIISNDDDVANKISAYVAVFVKCSITFTLYISYPIIEDTRPGASINHSCREAHVHLPVLTSIIRAITTIQVHTGLTQKAKEFNYEMGIL